MFVDLEKTYDSVPRNLLWKVIKTANVYEKTINSIKEIYYRNNCTVKVGSKYNEQ